VDVMTWTFFVDCGSVNRKAGVNAFMLTCSQDDVRGLSPYHGYFVERMSYPTFRSLAVFRSEPALETVS
jgi:hypothetical protein